jgi:hypothetical protein
MMFQEFSGPFEKLTQFFPIKDQEKKCAAYFEYFKNKHAEAWEKVVEHCVKKKARFPLLQEVLELYEMFRGTDVAKECDTCSGSGWCYVLIDGTLEVRRAPCVHGEVLSKKAGPIYTGPRKFDAQKPNQDELNYRWAKMITNNPKRFNSGWQMTGPIMKKQNPDIFEKVVSYAEDIFGKNHLNVIAIKSVCENKTSNEGSRHG